MYVPVLISIIFTICKNDFVVLCNIRTRYSILQQRGRIGITDTWVLTAINEYAIFTKYVYTYGHDSLSIHLTVYSAPKE